MGFVWQYLASQSIPYQYTKCFFLFALLLLTSLSVFAQQDMKADIMAANQKFMTAFQQGAITMANYYTSDAQLFPPNSDVVKGTAHRQ